MTESYDVVLDTLQKERDELWKRVESNMKNNMMNIMDDIRLKHIEEINEAIDMWRNR
jgi:hypothetical protein